MKTTSAISIVALTAALLAAPAMADGLNIGAGVGASAGVSSSSDDGDSATSVDLGVNTDVVVTAQSHADESGDDGVDTGVTGSIGGAVNASTSDDGSSLDLDALVNLITIADYNDDSFSAWSSANANVTTVLSVDDLFDAEGNAAIDAAVSANPDEQDDLQAAISANADLSVWLETNDIDLDSVIAIDVAADGSVDVYEG